MRVDIDNAMPRCALEEQARLAGKVVGHVGVIVEMVARQVGEQRRIETNTVNASLRQGVR